ncbi:MAG: hypothetical protein ACFFDR_10355 [Candidatus Thorarchaeota archaeon]
MPLPDTRSLDDRTKLKSRGTTIKTYNYTLKVYNTLLEELRSQRGEINLKRERGEVSFREYWDLRMSIEHKIQDALEMRDAIMKDMIAGLSGR